MLDSRHAIGKENNYRTARALAIEDIRGEAFFFTFTLVEYFSNLDFKFATKVCETCRKENRLKKEKFEDSKKVVLVLQDKMLPTLVALLILPLIRHHLPDSSKILLCKHLAHGEETEENKVCAFLL